MKKLVETTAAIGVTEVILVAVAIVRNKYIAVTIGPEGFGIYSLLNSFFQMVGVFAGTWMAAGTTKYISEYYNSEKAEETNQTFTFSVATTFGLGIILTTLLIVGQPQLRERFLSPEIAKSYYLLFAAGFVWMNLRPVFLSVLQGLMQVKEVVQARILISVVDLLLILVLVYLFQLLGFFVSLLLSAIWAAVLLFYFVRSRGRLSFKRVSLKDTVAKKLMAFGGINLFLALINLGSQYLQRILIVQKMDINSVGIFQAGVALMAYVGLVNRGSAFYFLPKMSEIMSDKERAIHIDNYLFFILLMSIPICSTAILFGDWGIQLLYSDRFLPLVPCLFWFVLAQFFSNIGSAFQLTLVGTVRLGMHTISVIAIHSLWVLVPFLWLQKYGIGSLGMGFVAGGVAGMLLNFVYLRYRIRLRLSNRNIYLFILAVGGFIFSKIHVDAQIIWRIVILAVIATATLSFINLKERSAIIGIINNRVRGVLSAKGYGLGTFWFRK